MKTIKQNLDKYVNERFVELTIKYRFEMIGMGEYGIVFEIKPYENNQTFSDAEKKAIELISEYQKKKIE